MVLERMVTATGSARGEAFASELRDIRPSSRLWNEVDRFATAGCDPEALFAQALTGAPEAIRTTWVGYLIRRLEALDVSDVRREIEVPVIQAPAGRHQADVEEVIAMVSGSIRRHESPPRRPQPV